jgi:hypothetical protein
MSFGYVVHPPDWQGSGGIRALHVLCRDLGRVGRRACISSVSGGWHSPEPYGLEDVHSWTPEEIEDAVHVYPEGFQSVPDQRVARWMLNTPRDPYNPPGDIFVWIEELMPGVPRLMVDLLERDLFYPKAEPGKGMLYWIGDGRPQPHEIPPGAQPIVASTRAEVAEVLRSADLLVSFDWFTAVNLEASVVGTPVLLIGSAQREKTSALLGSYGISADEGEARATVGKMFEHYEGVRAEIAGDVRRFAEVCER